MNWWAWLLVGASGGIIAGIFITSLVSICRNTHYPEFDSLLNEGEE